jgi:hypothetical protein
MTWFLIKRQFVLLCRLSIGVRTGQGCGFVLEGGEKEHIEKCLLICENIDDGYLRQTWMEV